MIQSLEIDGVFFEINNRPILSNIYLQCKSNEITGLFGKNGSGKSTLMKIIFGTLNCESSIRINDESIKKLNNKNELISFLPQFNFIPKSLSIYQALYFFGLNTNKFENTFPEFSNKTTMKLNELSGGQRRFIDLYVILFSNSKYALLDEPFTHLSPLQIEKAKELITQAKEKKGILISDHLYHHILDISDKNYMLLNGKTTVVNDLLDLQCFGYISSSK